MEEIIKKAIEGGWKPATKRDIYFAGANNGIMEEGGSPTINGWSVWSWKDEPNKDSSFCHPHSETVLDPLFWQALGKACGWFSGEECNAEDICVRRDEWLEYAIRFHTKNLTEGWDKAVEYISKITRGTALVN